uniref:C2H2-type domain-containing protein n=1 Tax=Parastrongyloides trichosuri TaxID=131310 RepID=A0A0N4Z3X5_PARTI
MPYRSELKRPDLKGQFPCSVCGKVFCHSSSLSRHRMQAHFKSYTCSQCNQEISSSETLRSHMFRIHQISRMFMCRCCNWAFADKTSLHIHMQSMNKDGNPGDVYVLARSSTEAGTFRNEMSSDGESRTSNASSPLPIGTQSPAEASEAKSAINFTAENLGLDFGKHPFFSNDKTTNNIKSSIFPQFGDGIDMFMKMKNPQPQVGKTPSVQDLFGQNSLLNCWLATNPLCQNNIFDLSNPNLLNLGKLSSLPVSGKRPEASVTAEIVNNGNNRKEEISVKTEECNSDSGKSDIHENSPYKTSPSFLDNLFNKKLTTFNGNDDVSPSLSRANKRKARKPQQLKDASLNSSNGDDDSEPQTKISNLSYLVQHLSANVKSDKLNENQEQHSPAISDSHTCESGQNNSTNSCSSEKCDHCKRVQKQNIVLQEENNKVRRRMSKIESAVFKFEKAIKEYSDKTLPEDMKSEMINLVDSCFKTCNDDETLSEKYDRSDSLALVPAQLFGASLFSSCNKVSSV